MTLGDKIRALKSDYVGAAVHIALNRAAALADEHEAETDALVAAAYEDAAQRADAFDSKMFRDRYSVDRQGRKQWNEARVLACENQAINITAEDIATAIRGLTDADAKAALDRIKAEARKEGHKEGMREAAGIAAVRGALTTADAILAAAGEAGNG